MQLWKHRYGAATRHWEDWELRLGRGHTSGMMWAGSGLQSDIQTETKVPLKTPEVGEHERRASNIFSSWRDGPLEGRSTGETDHWRDR